MKIIKETTDPKELALCYATHGIFVNLDRLGTHPTVLELVVLHELYHLVLPEGEPKAGLGNMPLGTSSGSMVPSLI